MIAPSISMGITLDSAEAGVLFDFHAVGAIAESPEIGIMTSSISNASAPVVPLWLWGDGEVILWGDEEITL